MSGKVISLNFINFCGNHNFRKQIIISEIGLNFSKICQSYFRDVKRHGKNNTLIQRMTFYIEIVK